MQVADKIKSERAARAAFLAELNPELRKQYRKGKQQNLQCRDIRTAWLRWLSAACKACRITETLADTVIL